MSCGVGHRRSSDHIAVAVAWAGGCSSDQTPQPGNLHMLQVQPQKRPKKKGVMEKLRQDWKMEQRRWKALIFR